MCGEVLAPRYSLLPPRATTRSSAFRTASSNSGSPCSVRYAPCAKLTLFGDGSSRNAATRPRIGSAGTGVVPANSEIYRLPAAKN